mgnify:FL=1
MAFHRQFGAAPRPRSESACDHRQFAAVFRPESQASVDGVAETAHHHSNPNNYTHIPASTDRL